jgi:murein DD-endopeptidase MepM/ murein hydrolase activator NlpD
VSERELVASRGHLWADGTAMTSPLRRIKPGWYLLVLLALYAAVVTAVTAGQRSELSELRRSLAAQPNRASGSAAAPAAAPANSPALWFPLPGAEIPENPAHLPGSVRSYRRGVSQGFDFYDGDSGVPVPYGAAVIAAAPGTVVRVDGSFREADADEWRMLMAAVADGADDEELDRLRGRQVWLETDDGRILRYAHLSAVRQGLSPGERVERGRVLGYVGNSGTDEGVAGTRRGARLHFEVWEGDSFFGERMNAEEVRIAAVSLFTGP